MQTNYLLVQAIEKMYRYLGDAFEFYKNYQYTCLLSSYIRGKHRVLAYQYNLTKPPPLSSE